MNIPKTRKSWVVGYAGQMPVARCPTCEQKIRWAFFQKRAIELQTAVIQVDRDDDDERENPGHTRTMIGRNKAV